MGGAQRRSTRTRRLTYGASSSLDWGADELRLEVSREEDGRLEEVLEDGRHRRSRRRRSVVRVLVRPRLLVVPSQEVLTADGLSVKMSLTAAVRTADPRRWHEAVEHSDGFVYAALQIALREAVGARTLDELLVACCRTTCWPAARRSC